MQSSAEHDGMMYFFDLFHKKLVVKDLLLKNRPYYMENPNIVESTLKEYCI